MSSESESGVEPLGAPFLAAVIEHVAHPVFVKDRRFRFVLVNRALCDLLEVEREALIGRTDYDLFSRHEADAFRAKDEELFTTGATVEIAEEPLTPTEGATRILATTKVPIRAHEDRVTHLVGIIHDITDIKEAEESLRRTNVDLEARVAAHTEALREAQQELLRKERLAVLGQLAGGLAHQLRNPLGAMQNALALLARGKLDRQQQQALEIIAEEVRRADHIIRDLLDYARIRPAQLQRVVLLDVLEDTLQQVERPSTIAVELDVAEELAVQADPVHLQSALTNLVRNAVEALHSTGRVTITARRAERHVELAIADDGPGIPAQIEASLFHPLVTTKSLGVGLGLSTARNLVENQGGQLVHERVLPHGACFRIVLRHAPSEVES